MPYHWVKPPHIITEAVIAAKNDRPGIHLPEPLVQLPRVPLHAFLWALIIQRIFSITTDSLLLVFLHYSRHLREFCGFNKVPDASKITRFKQDFLEDIQAVFERLVDLTEPICQAIDSCKADMTIFDS